MMNGYVENMMYEFLDRLIRFGIKVILALIIFYIGCRLIRVLRKGIRKFMEKVKCDKGVIQFTDAFVKVALIFLLVLFIGTYLGLHVTGVATLIGSAGVTIGLAIQGSLSNFVGGILLLVLKPFKVGDYIVEDSHKNEGTVQEISLFYTKLITMDGKLVVLPNGMLANSSLTNVTGQDDRRIDLYISVAYDTDIKKAKKILYDLMDEEEKVNHEKNIDVFVHDLADSAIVLGMRCYVNQADYWNVRWNLLENIKIQLDENGIEIPYNHLDVKICENAN